MNGNNELNNFIFQSKYAKYNPIEGRKETFRESVERVFKMHEDHLSKNYPHVWNNTEFTSMFLEAKEYASKGIVFGSQRALQFGGDKILKSNAKQYNCSYSYCDRPEFFKELLWILLCGCGVGCSVHSEHTNKLPVIKGPDSEYPVIHEVEDSIEGWALAVDSLMNSYFNDDSAEVLFDYKLIRPKGAMISGGFIAPGPDGLRKAIEKIRIVLDNAVGRKLKPIECFSINCHLADSVLSGGVRRSALSTLFDPKDEEMRNAKTGNWFYDNPHFARSNNSILLTRDESNKDLFYSNFEAAKGYGEPGFAFVDNINVGYNPCFEIAMNPILDDGRTGWSFCNLSTISGKEIKTEQDFLNACKYASVIGTIQASYNKFEFLGSVTEELVKRDNLLGVSISGLMMNPDLLLNKDVLRCGANTVKVINAKIANIIGIGIAKRLTCIKPGLLNNYNLSGHLLEITKRKLLELLGRLSLESFKESWKYDLLEFSKKSISSEAPDLGERSTTIPKGSTLKAIVSGSGEPSKEVKI